MKQFKYFLAALMFYTRIPVPKIKNYDKSMFNGSSQYLPLVGLIMGGLTALVFYFVSLVLPAVFGIIISMGFSILLTGAFHEDGLADFADGFGGGYTKEKILAIMKDSTIGTYGAISLGFILLFKFLTQISINETMLFGIIIAGHTFSRTLPIILIHSSKYARTDNAKVTTAIENRSGWALTFALCCGLIPIAWVNLNIFILFLIVSLILFVWFKYYIQKKIGGYTGDILGALQQISEVCFYFCAVIYINNPSWSFI